MKRLSQKPINGSFASLGTPIPLLLNIAAADQAWHLPFADRERNHSINGHVVTTVQCIVFALADLLLYIVAPYFITHTNQS